MRVNTSGWLKALTPTEPMLMAPHERMSATVEPIQTGQVYLLPSGNEAVVVNVGLSNIACMYVRNDGVRDEVCLVRGFFMKEAKRVVGPNLSETDSTLRS